MSNKIKITNIITGILECVLWFLRWKRHEKQNKSDDDKKEENEKTENNAPGGDE